MTLGSLSLPAPSFAASVRRAGASHGAVFALVACLAACASVRALLLDGAGEPHAVGYVVASVLSVLAWGLLAALARESLAARFPQSAAFAPIVLVGAATWLRQISEDFRAWSGMPFAPLPLGGLVPLPGWLVSSREFTLPDARVWVAWQTGWLVLDAGVVLLVARVLRRRRMPVPATVHPRVEVVRAHAAVAVGAQAMCVLVIASTTALLTTTAGADLAHGARVALDNAILLTIALAAGVFHPRPRRIGLGLTLAVALGIAAVRSTGDQYDPLLPEVTASPPLDSWAPTTPHWFVLNAAIVTLLGWILLAHRPIVRMLGQAQTHANLTLGLGLAANTIDAAATWLGVEYGVVDERNPVVRQTGLGLKWIVVTVLLLALRRLRPRLLWIVTACYLLVVGYHLLGVTLLA